MKNIVLTLCIFTASTVAMLAQNDAAAIQKAIESESQAFHTNPDRNVFISFWQITDDTRLVYSGPDGNSFISGKEILNAITNGQLPPTDNASAVFSNYTIKFSGVTGWASFDQENTDATGKKSYMHEFRMMEKVNGNWKIVSSSVHQYAPK